ncbi:DNA-directed RNA polymerase 2 [Morus notabilis]|uniref:DNA-directed RNA polymerase 2 n=1 Tax=Morus notabilis TaxID=981085 RepID=W9RKJ0_9ROSA|nr:DNA-directed RNA polymerase 2 [Morus notabilis]
MDMCLKKLVPNLPYMKSLFLGWFEPLRNAIKQEQEMYQEGKNRTMCSSYFDLLSPEMMSVITMHKLAGVLMSRGGNGIARVVQASLLIGDAIKQEV